MARILLGVTGSVAAIRVPALFQALRSLDHEVRVVATEPALYFFDPAELVEAESAADSSGPLFRDRDEWPGLRYRRGDPVLHIEFRKWADLLLVAPLDANTLAKFALGLCDNLLSCLFRAWDFEKPVVLAPAMNTFMWQSPVTARHLGQLLLDRGQSATLPPDWGLETAAAAFARLAPQIILVPPQSKRLACGDIGIGAMAEVATIAEAVRSWAERAAAELEPELRESLMPSGHPRAQEPPG
jgi:phosphopantothenoylcysteine decarboxylase